MNPDHIFKLIPVRCTLILSYHLHLKAHSHRRGMDRQRTDNLSECSHWPARIGSSQSAVLHHTYKSLCDLQTPTRQNILSYFAGQYLPVTACFGVVWREYLLGLLVKYISDYSVGPLTVWLRRPVLWMVLKPPKRSQTIRFPHTHYLTTKIRLFVQFVSAAVFADHWKYKKWGRVLNSLSVIFKVFLR
jgi:hypothetical protein